MKRTTVLLAEDHTIVREGIRKMIEMEADLEVVGEAKNGQEAVAMVKELHPALVLMDVSMPLLNGFQATRQILEAVPATKVIMLSAYNDEAYVEEATNSGAMGYLIKQTSTGSVCHAIREVQKGKTFFSPSISSHLRKRNGKKRMDGVGFQVGKSLAASLLAFRPETRRRSVLRVKRGLVAS
jgi:DNA-binding NarL/FixJ family response regulator